AKSQYIDSLYLIDDTKLGVVLTAGSKINILSYDLATEKSKILKTLDTQLISSTVWYGDENKFSYLEMVDNQAGESVYKIVYIDNTNSIEASLDGVAPHRGTS